ncbi:MAG: A/G-specific adenine glycosylase [Saprospiraceae bacterium]
MLDTKTFSQRILAWSKRNPRRLPWTGEKDPYKVWLSEIILQQTRVEQGAPYYRRFVERFPTVRDLAAAPTDEVLKLWEGLGYYSRARNLHHTAKYVAEDLKCQFPTDYAGIRALKGVGDYTAAAIASFAYGLPHAVLDGNVLRVLARWSGSEADIGSGAGKKHFATLAQALLPAHAPGPYNQAMMDIGATVCTPRNPDCARCPLSEDCVARLTNAVERLPVKASKPEVKNQYWVFGVLLDSDSVWIYKREERDIWQGLYAFPGQVSEAPPQDPQQAFLDYAAGLDPAIPHGLSFVECSETYRHQLTHRRIYAVFCMFFLKKKDVQPAFPSNWLRIPRSDMKKIYAFPRLIQRYLEDNAYICGSG